MHENAERSLWGAAFFFVLAVAAALFGFLPFVEASDSAPFRLPAKLCTGLFVALGLSLVLRAWLSHDDTPR